MVKWQNCFIDLRMGDEEKTRQVQEKERSEFEVDYDRIIFSTAFRRMQDKTQVIPLPEHDFVHTRLTHSLEASSVGRSLGKRVGVSIVEKYPELRSVGSPSDFASIVSSACLAHDIGNPPFGHSGEDVIKHFFLNGNGRKYQVRMEPDEWADLINFEGNATGFKMLTDAQSGSKGGLKLTYATLAAFTKYPRSSSRKATDKPRESQKKNGFYVNEREVFRTIAERCGLKKLDDFCWVRHPLAFLVEAADDICYRVIDFEDGARLGLIPFQEAEVKLQKIIDADNFNPARYDGITDKKEKIGYLRAKAINNLIAQVVDVFLLHEVDIRAGAFDIPLIEKIQCAKPLKELKEISIEKVYRSMPVLRIEAAGFAVIGGLLDLFINALNDNFAMLAGTAQRNFHSEKVLELLPDQYLENGRIPPATQYGRIMRVCEFVSGMTDSYALSMYRQLTGIEI